MTLTNLDLPALLLLGNSAAGTITLSGGAPPNSTVAVSSTQPGVVSITPASIQLSSGALSATFTVQGTRVGPTQIVATMSGSTVSKALTVRTKFKDKDKEGSKDIKDKEKDKERKELFKELEVRDLQDSPFRRGMPFDGRSLIVGPPIARAQERTDGGAVDRAFIRPDERPQLTRPLLQQPDT